MKFLVLLCLSFFSTQAFSAEYADFSVDESSWRLVNQRMNQWYFECSECDARVGISVGCSLPLNPPKTNDDFLASMESESSRTQFFNYIFKAQKPAGIDASIVSIDSKKTHFASFDAIQIAAQIEILNSLAHENLIIFVHDNKLWRLALNYQDGDLTSINEKAINSFYSSFRLK